MSSAARMTYDDSDEARNSTHPTVDDLPKKPRKPSSRKTMVMATVVVVLVAAVSGAIYVTENSHNIHLGIVPYSAIEKLTNQSLHGSYNNSTTNYASKNITKESASLFINTTGVHMLAISSVEFISSAYNLNYYNSVYQNLSNSSLLRFHNDSYEGFSFFYGVANISGNYTLVAVGHSGQFSFFILDTDVWLSSATTLIHDEIHAMTP